MAMMGIVTEEFKEENYDYWKTCLQSYLVGEGLWDVVSPEVATPDEKHKSEEWKRKNAKALHAIQLAYGSKAYAKYKKMENVTAKIAWAHLVELCPSSSQHSDVTHDQQDGDKRPLPNEELYNAIENGEIEKVSNILKECPEATTRSVSSHGDTALHIAILCGKTDIALDLVKKMPPEGLEIRNTFNDTPLTLIAAITETTELAKAMLEKNQILVSIKGGKTGQSSLPVIVASMYGRKKMVDYLYSETPKHLLKGQDGVLLLNHLIIAGFFDIASNLLNWFPKLGIMADPHGDYALHKLAHKPSAFARGSKFPFWKKWIYNRK
ncbi:hypothetical protein M8C21_008823 [Ambrosia artemisiifolia]|uniref:DUF4219 domain-containing protein n=1 Tax=Ambrosia artemisiifolia TaxID=4212 RepID=A0AAD5BLS5_AMBAR|nr:hypothetical protein M8C21_008823 [Ambrosia artemisiifolia]